ncbi:MAG: DUF599 domain-containing protein [Magnetospiraceae bacterium]
MDLRGLSALGATPLDIFGIAVFLVVWTGYTYFADKASEKQNLNTVMHAHRLQWMREMLLRETRIVDGQILGYTMQNVSLFASVSVLIIGGLLALLGSAETARSAFLALPFVVQTSGSLWEIKVLSLAFLFVYAFFKFAWSLRQFNYTATLMGASPPPKAEDRHDAHAQKLARLGTLAVLSYNRGVRSYYFGVALLTWFLHPVLLAITAVWVARVVYRREFKSKTLKVLTTD